MSRGPALAGSEGGFLSGVQFVLVSATMPRGLEKSIGAYIPVSSSVLFFLPPPRQEAGGF